MPKQVKILFAGGGSGGHITPNLALIDYLLKKNLLQKEEMLYIGTNTGIENQLVPQAGIRIETIQAGKLRRYFDWQNFVDLFRIGIGILQSFFLIRKYKPLVVFSKGGFLSLHVAVAAWLNRIPVITHESDIVSGLANRLIKKVAQKVCLTFPKERYDEKEILTGLPLRETMFQGDAEKGRGLLHFAEEDKPVLLVMGGSLGSRSINEFIWKNLFVLSRRFNIVHVVGKGNLRNFAQEQKFYSACSWDEVQKNLKSYRAFEYLDREQADLFAAADIFLVRAGATTIVELALLKKLMILVPLTTAASRGEQGLNADFMRKKEAAYMIEQNDLTSKGVELLSQAWTNQSQRATMIENASGLFLKDADERIVSILQQYLVK